MIDKELMSEVKAISSVSLEYSLSLVTVVGSHLGEEAGSVQRIIGCLTKFPIRLINHGASRSNVSFLVENSITNAVIEELHNHILN